MDAGRGMLRTKGTLTPGAGPIQSEILSGCRRQDNLDCDSKEPYHLSPRHNNYIDASVQKGGITGCAGCLELTASINQLIKQAKRERRPCQWYS